MQPAYLQALTELGLTGLEAEAYGYLLEHSPATGYAVAKGLGKPTANTYKALASLYGKGALIREESANREFRPVSPGELLGALERRFQERKRRASSELRRVKESEADDRVYRLETPEQVLERLRQMLSRCRKVAVLDLFSWAVEHLKDDLEAAAARGLKVAVKVYEPCSLRGVHVVAHPRPERVARRWPGQWANAVIDGHEYLLALLSHDGARVHQAIWSGSAFLSLVYHLGLVSELQVDDLERNIKDGASREDLVAILERYDRLKVIDMPGYRMLRQVLGKEQT